MNHSELIIIAKKWLLKNTPCSFAFTELSASGCYEIPDIIGFNCYNCSIVVEVKTSRSDFFNDANKIFRKYPKQGMGGERFYCCPDGLIKSEELPEKWGLIYVNDKGKARCIKKNYRGNIGVGNSFEKNIVAENYLLCSALRRIEIRGLLDTIYDKI